jgi:ankyrin repeat protein
LAKAIEKEDVKEVEKLVKKEPKLLEITSSSGSNVLSLCLYIEKFDLFKKLLELGANPNFINPKTKHSVLIDACKPFGSSLNWITDNRYAELLLHYKADPNYYVGEDFAGITLYYSPLIKASSLNLELVKLLIENGADPDKRLGNSQEKPFSYALSSNKFDIIYYYIDSIKINVHEPLFIRSKDSLYIQDYVKKYMSYEEGSNGYKEKQKLIKYLEYKGVNFNHYLYKSN